MVPICTPANLEFGLFKLPANDLPTIRKPKEATELLIKKSLRELCKEFDMLSIGLDLKHKFTQYF